MSITFLNYPVKRTTLAKVYKINDQSFREWLRDIGITHGRTLSPADLKKIVANYDLPEGVSIKWDV